MESALAVPHEPSGDAMIIYYDPSQPHHKELIELGKVEGALSTAKPNEESDICGFPGQFDVIVTSSLFGDILSDQMQVLWGWAWPPPATSALMPRFSRQCTSPPHKALHLNHGADCQAAKKKRVHQSDR
jgi:Isocitrate/isopropylmalate dehydrogenase